MSVILLSFARVTPVNAGRASRGFLWGGRAGRGAKAIHNADTRVSLLNAGARVDGGMLTGPKSRVVS